MLNFDFIKIVGDGNCLFRALAFHLFQDESQHPSIRELICDYIEHNKNNFCDFFFEDKVSAINKTSFFLNYINEMRKPGVYGDNACLYGFSKIFQAKIHIIQHKREKIVIQDENSNYNKEFFLLFHQQHYSCLIPKS